MLSMPAPHTIVPAPATCGSAPRGHSSLALPRPTPACVASNVNSGYSHAPALQRRRCASLHAAPGGTAAEPSSSQSSWRGRQPPAAAYAVRASTSPSSSSSSSSSSAPVGTPTAPTSPFDSASTVPASASTASQSGAYDRGTGGAEAAGLQVPWLALEPPFTYMASAEAALSNAVPSGLAPMWKMLLLSDGSVTRHLQLLSGSPVTVECLSMSNVGWSVEGAPPGTDLIPGPRVQRQVLLRCKPVGGVGSDPPVASSSGGDGGEDGSQPPQQAAASGSSTGIGGHGSNGNGCDGGNGDMATATYKSKPHGAPSTSTPAQEDCGSGSSSSGSDASSSSSSSRTEAEGVPLVYACSWWNADTVDSYLRDRSKPIWISLSQGHVELYREVHALFRGAAPPELEALLGCKGPFWGRHYIFWSGGAPLTLIYEVFSPRLGAYLGPQAAESWRGGELEEGTAM